jgi:hypothetical protein
VDKIDKFKIKNQDLTDSFMPGREKVFGAILGAAKQHAKSKDNRDQLRSLLEGGTMAAMDTGKVEMRKAPGAKKAEEALSTAADFIPFVGAGKSAMQGDYGSAALQAGMDVAGGPLLKGAAALGGKAIPALAGIFIGPKSKLWDKGAAKQFMQLEKAGTAPEEIWRQTGTFRSPDGILRQEINDAPSRLRRERVMDLEAEHKRIRNLANAEADRLREAVKRGEMSEEEMNAEWEKIRWPLLDQQAETAVEYQKASDLAMPGELRGGRFPTLERTLYHPEAFEAYPKLKYLRTEYKVDPSMGSPEGGLAYTRGQTSWTRQDPWKMFSYGRSTPETRNIMLHEMQHGIQHLENMGLGGNPDKEWGMLPSQMHPTDYVRQLEQSRKMLMNEQEALRQQIPSGGFNSSLDMAGLPNPILARHVALTGRINDLDKTIESLRGGDVFPLYKRMAGEAEARAVQARMNMTPEERLAKFPLESYDVPVDQLVVRTEPYAKGGEVHMARGGDIKALINAVRALDLPPAAASQRTQIPGTEPTYRKAKEILDREMPGGRTLDYGSGLGIGSRVLGSESFEPFPREGVAPTYTRAEDIPSDAFHRLVNLNMLNVVPRDVRDAAVENIGRVMRPGGMGLVTTRGKDVMKASGELGPEPNSMITSIGTYQKGFTPEELREYLQYILGNKYDIGRLNLGPAGAVVRKKGMKEGGEVHAANGLPLTFAYDKPDPDALQNWMRENQFGKVDIPAPYKVKPEEVTVARAMRTPAPEMSAKDKLRTLLQEGVKQGKKEVKTLGDPNAVTDLVNRGLIANNPVSGAIDLVNMGLEPFGLGSEMPIGGSAHVQKLMKDYGFTKQERPLLETGLALASPFMPAAAKATEGMTAGLAIKPVGGQWLSGNRGPKSVGEFRARDDAINLSPESIQRKRDITDAHRRAYEAEPTETNRRLMETSRAVLEGAERHAAVNNWIDSNLQNYLRKQMGTPDDPVLKLAEEGVLHMPHRDVPLMSDVSRAREIAGFPALGTATTDLGRMWENLTDAQIASINAGTLRDPKAMREIFDQRMAMDQNLRGNRVPGQPETLEEKSRAWDWGSAPAIVQSIREKNPWLEKLNPDEMVYRMRNRGDLGETLGVDHIIDVLREDMTTGRIRPEQLSKMSMEQAVRRTAAYDAERAAAMAKADEVAAVNLTPHRDYQNGFRMVQLDKPGQFAKESDRMGHSVRGYEPPINHPEWIESSGNRGSPYYNHGGWEAIKSGQAQVLSFRDSKNAPHATLEIEKPGLTYQEMKKIIDGYDMDESAKMERLFQLGYVDEAGNVLPDQPNSITQIKGKVNQKVNEDYWPFLQRYVRESGADVERDLDKIGMFDITGYAARTPDIPKYVTESEFDRWRSTGKFTPDSHFSDPEFASQGMKRGGRVKSGALSSVEKR